MHRWLDRLTLLNMYGASVNDDSSFQSESGSYNFPLDGPFLTFSWAAPQVGQVIDRKTVHLLAHCQLSLQRAAAV